LGDDRAGARTTSDSVTVDAEAQERNFPSVFPQIVRIGVDEMLGAMNLQQQDENICSLEEITPEIEERVIVLTPKFRCLGYLDRDGVWRYAVDGVPIEGVLKWTRNFRR
jgi:hypothetical protein